MRFWLPGFTHGPKVQIWEFFRFKKYYFKFPIKTTFSLRKKSLCYIIVILSHLHKNMDKPVLYRLTLFRLPHNDGGRHCFEGVSCCLRSGLGKIHVIIHNPLLNPERV